MKQTVRDTGLSPVEAGADQGCQERAFRIAIVTASLSYMDAEKFQMNSYKSTKNM